MYFGLLAVKNVGKGLSEKIISEREKNGNFKNTWKKYYDQYEDIKDYKIGFELSVDINAVTQTNLLLNPKNQHKIYPYLYAYTYDDIHNSGYYSHVTMDTLKDDTVFSSIKV